MKLEIDTEMLGRDQENLRFQLRKLKGNLDRLTTSMDSLNQTWEGPAREAYMAQYQRDRQSLENLCGVLEEFVSRLEYAKIQYQECDSKVKQTVSQIRI